MRARLISRCLLAIVVSVWSAALSAQSTTWLGTNGSDWDDPANWTAGVPNPGTDAEISTNAATGVSTAGAVAPACRSLTVEAGASLTIDAFTPLEVYGRFQGAASGGGAVRLVGTATAEVVDASCATLLVDRSTGLVTIRNTVTTAALELRSGTLRTFSGADTLHVTGDAQMLGGELTRWSSGTLDVDGDLTFAGTAVASPPSTIRCGGDWASDAVFAPTSGIVEFDGQANQSVSAVAFRGLTVAGSTVTAASHLTVNGALVVSSQLDLGGNVLDANSSANVSGTLLLGQATHTFAGNLDPRNGGSVQGTGTLEFDGQNSATVYPLTFAGSMEMAKTALLSVRGGTVSVSSLVQRSGTLRTYSGTDTLHVTGDAQMLGGDLTRWSSGIFDVDGDLTFAGTAVASPPPTIRCGGDWTSDAAFAPSSGVVAFDGQANQVVSAVAFRGLTVAGSTVTAVSNLTVNGPLVVSSQLDLGGNVLDANSSANVSGTLLLGQATHTFAGNLDPRNGGSVQGTGTLEFDGQNSATVYPLTFSGSMEVNGTALLTIRGGTVIVSSLVQRSGTLRTYTGTDTLHVTGNAQMLGGDLTRWSSGIFDVDGDLTFAGTAVASPPPTIRCGGDWTSDAAFAPTSGIVEFDGQANQSVSAVAFRGLTVAGSTVTAGSNLTVNGPLVVSSQLDLGGNVLDANSSANVSGTLLLGQATHTFAGNLDPRNGGSVQGTGTLVFDGQNSATVYPLTFAGSMEMAKTALLSVRGGTVSVSSLVQRSGTLRTYTGTDTLHVTGNAQMLGGDLTRWSSGIFDVDGDLTFAGTAVTSPPPTIRCGGDWISDAAFAPTAGTVTLDGGSPQTVQQAGSFATLAVSGVDATLDTDTTVTGGVTVTGSLATNSHELRIGVGLDASNGGTLLGPGQLVFDGSQAAEVQPVTYSGGLRMAKSGLLTIRGTVSVGSLVQESGTLRTFSGDTLRVVGDASFRGGELTRWSSGMIDVDGNVEFVGTSSTNPPQTFSVGGDWVSDGGFAPTSGTVVFDGDGALSTTSGGALAFFGVQVASGVRGVADPVLELAANSLAIDAGATLDAGGSTLRLSVPALSPAGTLAVGAGGELQLPALPIQTAGLSAIGSPSSPARVASDGSGRYGLVVTGILAASNAEFEGLDANGLVVPAATVLAPEPNDLRAVQFRGPEPTAGACLLNIERSVATQLFFSEFENPDQATGVFNVIAPQTSAPITFVNFSGDLGGDAFESDPGDLVTWTSQVLTQLTGFTATAGIEEVTLDWGTTDEAGVASYQLGRGSSASGPFTVVATLPVAGPSNYQHVDTGLTAGTRYFYQLAEVVDINSVVQELSVVDATPLAESTQLALGTAPTSPVEAGAPWPNFTVRIENGAGQLNPSATDDVTLAVTSGPAISGVLTVAAQGGVATFSGLSATGAGPISFDLTAQGLTPVTGLTVLVDPADATQLVLSVAPASSVVAGQIMPRIELQAVDAYGNRDTDFDGAVSVTAVGSGALGGAPSVTASAGVAEFVDLSYDTAEAITLDFGASNLLGVSAPVTVQAAAPTALRFGAVPPVTAVAGDPIAPFTIEIQDQLGNLVATVPPELLTVSLHVGGATLLGNSPVTTSGGVAAISGLSYERAEPIVLRITSANYGSIDTPPVQVVAADPASISFDGTPPSVYYQNAIGTPIAIRFEDAYGNLASQATETVTLTVPDLVGSLSGSAPRPPANGVATFGSLAFDTPQTALVRFDVSGLSPLELSISVVSGFSDLRLGQGAIRVVPQAPALAQPSSVFVDVTNAGQVNADGLISVYVDSVDPANLLGTASAVIGVGGVTTFEIPWAPAIDGDRPVLAVVDNRTLTERTPENNSGSILVSVGAASELLVVAAGDRLAWPGAAASVGVTIRNAGASATTLVGGTTSSSWLSLATPLSGVTLQPGESIVALADLTVPATAAGAPLGSLPVLEEIDIDITTAASSWSGGLRVKLFDQPTGSATVTVRAGSQPLGGALVAFQDLPGVYTTDGAGQVTAALPPGSRGIAVYKQGYVPASIVEVVPEGLSSFAVDLTPGEALAIDSVEVAEVADPASRGVQINDPVNNTIYDFVLAMRVGDPILVPNVELPRGDPGTAVTYEVEREYSRTTSTPVPVGGRGLRIHGRIRYEPGVPGRIETWIVIPGEIVVLKDFFEITASIVNRAVAVQPTDVQLRQTSAALAPLPAGLALPDLDGVPQTLVQALPDLDAGESASTSWVVRGDLPGTYQLEVATSADLYGFNTFLTNVAETQVTSPFDVTLPSLSCELVGPGAVTAGQVFDFDVRITNDGASTAKQVRVNLRTEDLENCSLAPNQSAAVVTSVAGGVLLATIDLGDLPPGGQATATFQLISALSGVVVEERIVNGCQANPAPGVTVAGPPMISTHPVDETACEGNTVSFTVAASGAVPITYQWRKDGQPIAGEEADSLTLSPVAATDAGVYDVLVTNPGGTTASAVATLTVLAQPAADFGASVSGGPAPLIVQFNDQSTGSVTSWAWDFDGDGTTDSTDQNPAYTYASAGSFTVSLTVNGDCSGDTRTRAGLVNVVWPPVQAGFSGLPTSGVAPHTVQFANSSVGATSWAWDFDNDGSVDSTAQSPSHTYATPGTYAVSLTATGPGGQNTHTEAGYITVHEPVAAAFSGLPTSGTAPLTVQFGDLSTGADGWAWDFDNDGNVDSTQQNPSHTYTVAGSYTVSLLATGPGGTNTTTASQYITVYEPPVIRSFTVSPQTVTDGDNATLRFDFEHGVGTIDNGVGAVVSGVDESFVPPFDSVTQYRLTVTNSANDSVSAVVSVSSIPAAEILSFVATPSTLPNGQQCSLFSEFRGAVSAVIQPGNITVSNQSSTLVTPPPDTSTTYTLMVQNPLGDQALAVATVTAGAVPQITDHPDDVVESIGSPATFSVVASGPGTLLYQWYRDGVVIQGADQDTLSLPSVAPADEGSYTVSVGNAFGVVTSDPAYLTVLGTCNPCSGGVVRINCSVFADFSTSPPTISAANPSVRPYLSAVQQGASPADWKLVIDAGAARLVIGRRVCIHTGAVRTSGGAREAPGIELRSTCGIVVKQTAVLQVKSRCARAGDIRIQSGGDITIKGLVMNGSRGHGGVSGDIDVASRCGHIRVRRQGLLFSDTGGDISLVAGGSALGRGGDIEISGRVVAEYRDAAPTVRLVSFDGAVRVESSTLHGLCIGVARLRTSGVVVRARCRTPNPGTIEVQAQGDILVLGSSLRHFAFPNPGALAIEMPGNEGGGTIDVRSLGGSIHAVDRAFDNANHRNENAVNRLWAAGDIVFEASGAANVVRPNWGWGPYQMPVADVRTVGNGRSGTNLVRSFGGKIELLSADAVLLATPWSGAGTAGLNLLTASQGVVNQGLVLPADPDASDDSGVVAPAVPPGLHADSASIGVHWWW